MGIGVTTANSILKLYLNGTGIPNIADNTATSPLTNVYVSLHTADPTASGNQTSNEATYAGYVRQAVARTTGGWTVTGNSVSPVSNIAFLNDSGSYPYAAIGYAASGAGEIIASGSVFPPCGGAVVCTLTTSSTFTLT
jgi:hypothetical protein